MYKILPILLFAFLFSGKIEYKSLISIEDNVTQATIDSLRNRTMDLYNKNKKESVTLFLDSLRFVEKYSPEGIAFDSMWVLYPEIVIRGHSTYNEHYYYKTILLVEEIEARLNHMSDNNMILFNVTFEMIDSVNCNSESICNDNKYSFITDNKVQYASVDSTKLFEDKVIKDEFISNYSQQGMHIFSIREQTHLTYKDKIYYNPEFYEYKIITGKINIEGLHDYRIDKSLKEGFVNIINSMHLSLPNCDDCISFSSVDMDSLRGVNKTVKSTISLNREDIYDESWAVIIGIDKYENLSNLDYAVADAEAVKDMLINKFDYKEENVRLLLNEDANRTNIVKVISDVSLKASENDRILVFYAGHGETMPLPDGGEMGYLVPIDGNQDNLLASAIPMDDLKRFSNVSKAKHMLFLVDACYGGLAAVGSRGLEPAKTPNYIEKISNIKSRQIITAGGKDEQVFEKSEWGHSAYTKNLLSALEDGLADSNGDGYITADELGDYLSEKVSIDSENQQTPQSRRLTSHEGEFIFINQASNVTINKNEIHIIDNKSHKIPQINSFFNMMMSPQTNIYGFLDFIAWGDRLKIGAELNYKNFTIEPYFYRLDFNELGIIVQYRHEQFLIGIGTSNIDRSLIYSGNYGVNKVELATEYGNKYRSGIPFRLGIGQDKYFSIMLDVDLMNQPEDVINTADKSEKSKLRSFRYELNATILNKIFVNSGFSGQTIYSCNNYEFFYNNIDGSFGLEEPLTNTDYYTSSRRLWEKIHGYLSISYKLEFKGLIIKPGIVFNQGLQRRFDTYFIPQYYIDNGTHEMFLRPFEISFDLFLSYGLF